MRVVLGLAVALMLGAKAAFAITVGNDLVGTNSGSCIFQNGCPQSLGLPPHIVAENFSVGGAGATLTSFDFTASVSTSAPAIGGINWYVYTASPALPGTLVASGQATSVTQTLLPPIPSWVSYDIVKFSFALPSIALNSGSYWFGITLLLADDPVGQFYYWANTAEGDRRHAVFNGVAWAAGDGSGSLETRNNLAFHVSGDGSLSAPGFTEVPIPLSLPLFAAGAVLIYWTAKRRERSPHILRLSR